MNEYDDIPYPTDLVAEGLIALKDGEPVEDRPMRIRVPWDAAPTREQVAKFRDRRASRAPARVARSVRARPLLRPRERRTVSVKAGPVAAGASPEPAQERAVELPHTKTDIGFGREKREAVTDALADLIIACLE